MSAPQTPEDWAQYTFDLPDQLIAQQPLMRRDEARLMRVARGNGSVIDSEPSWRIRDLPQILREGDLLVMNQTRVLRARLRGRKITGGAAEALILRPEEQQPGYRALVRTNGRLREGLEFIFEGRGQSLPARITTLHPEDGVTLEFEGNLSPYEVGEAPLPPYIRRSSPDAQDEERYQTVYATTPGAVAAPTAGLHFTPDLLTRLDHAGIDRAHVVLHVGLGTFRPLRPEDLARDRLHQEWFDLPESTATAIDRTRSRGGRVIAVGTTSTRVLETQATGPGQVTPGQGYTDLFLHPGRPPQVVDGLLTNFHLPGSSLLMLVASLIGRDALLEAYRQAIESHYRFYSYGDAMLIL